MQQALVHDKLSKEVFQRVLPKSLRNSLTDGLLDKINTVSYDGDLRESYRDNLVSWSSVLKDGKYKLVSYLDAVQYVSYKMLGNSNVAAYTKTFPERIQRLLDDGASENKISGYVSAYNKTMLVNKIIEQTLVPVHILNLDLYQEALNRQAYLMMNANSEKVQTDAANSILGQLRPPEIKKLELSVGIKEDTAIDDLRKSTLELVEQQKKMIAAGAMSAEAVAKSSIVAEVLQEDS